MKKKIIVCGAGIAGLSAAHYLNERGFDVLVIESLDIPGGLARSERIKTNDYMPSEYSWRGFGPWYHNTFELMKNIPIYKNNQMTNVYDEELSNPINFILTPDTLQNFNKQINNFDNRLRLSTSDKIKLTWLSLQTMLASDIRSRNEYAFTNAKKFLEASLSAEGAATVSSLFGPWVGTDYTRASVHHVASFFRRNIFPGPPSPYVHQKSDRPFVQGNMSGWLILRSPSNEAWFDPWVSYLKTRGVKFRFGTKLIRLEQNTHTKQISYAEIETNTRKEKVRADYYVLAINPYITKDILNRTPSLLADHQLSLFVPLTKDSPHKQISFRIAFSEKINLYENETAIILVDSEFNITLFSQDQLWHKNIYLGPNVKSLWSGTATVDSVRGKLFDLPMKYLTRDEFIAEFMYQIYKSKSLNKLIMASNDGRELNSFPVERVEVWHSWIFPESNNRHEITDISPKWVNNSINFAYQPNAQTSINNLYLAGAHTQTLADLYSMEAAVESGKRVADLISGNQTVLPQYVPMLTIPFKTMDSVLYSMCLPNVTDVLFVIIILIILLWLIPKML